MVNIMIRAYWNKRKRILSGVFRGIKTRKTPLRVPNTWWDDNFYGREVSDAKTISRVTSQIAAKYHYASVEMLILRHFAANQIDSFDQLLDIGSGAGHWLRFYQDLGALRCVGIELSAKCVAALKAKYQDDESVEIFHGPGSETLGKFKQHFYVVNAIGVMYHIVDDEEWSRTIQLIGEAVRPGGLFVASGHFGWFNNANVQIDNHDRVNKRLRSRTCWRKHLYSAGFTNVKFYRNFSCLFVREKLPENNVMIATK